MGREGADISLFCFYSREFILMTLFSTFFFSYGGCYSVSLFLFKGEGTKKGDISF
jgi:hypothetical protein